MLFMVSKQNEGRNARGRTGYDNKECEYIEILESWVLGTSPFVGYELL